MEHRADLEEIIRSVKKKNLLLPDFQRGFVWDIEKQKSLVASVLARMPLGSILELQADSDEYGCRLLGRKEFLDMPKKEDIYVLLDGQQRLTVLANVFSNMVYYDYEKGGVLCQYKNLASVDLLNRFFLKLPSIEEIKTGKKKDSFGIYDLRFPLKNVEKEVPDFLTDEMEQMLEIKSFDEKSQEPYVPGKSGDLSIIKYCEGEADFLIPLYLLMEEEEHGSYSKLNKILSNIVDNVVFYRLECEYKSLEEEEKTAYIKRNLLDVHQEAVLEDGKIKEEQIEKEWRDQAKEEWAQKMLQYLLVCIRKLELHRITVPKTKRDRAIDIYENLNLGGITLSTFELVLAKAAKKGFGRDKNLHDMIVDYIQEPKTYPQELATENMESNVQAFIQRKKEYSASEHTGCYSSRKHQLNKKYTDAFLNILSLLSYVPDYEVEKIDISLIKREKILKLHERQICGNYKEACKGIDRACYFLQVRCGIRNIQELHYNLILVLLGYVLARDEYYQDKQIIKKLEAWYWIVIFSGKYDKDQNKNVISDLKSILESIQGGEYGWLREWQEKVFEMPGFSDEKTLLMETSVIPKNVIKNTICQFKLAETYKDLWYDKELNTLEEEADSYEEHHIVPLGTLNSNYKECERRNRNDKKSIFNSPLNYVYLTQKTNQKIGSQAVEYYIQQCNDTAVFELHLQPGWKAVDDEAVRNILKKRYKDVKAEITSRIAAMMK